MQDMIPPGDRSIRNIPLSPSHRRRLEEREDYPSEGTPPPMPPPKRRRFRWFWILAILVVAVAAAGAVLLATVFSGASVTVTPRTAAATVPPRISATLQAQGGALRYQLVSATRSATTTVQASGTKQVERQASGKIIIYNNYSAQNQRLIANTRFQAPDGKIYRIKESVDIPGMSSAPASIFADSPGADYNRQEKTKFTIPGFKGDPRYDKFYAESQGAISGGFIGREPAIAPADLQKARTAIEQALEGSLREAAQTGVPEGYVLINGTLATSFSDVATGPADGSAVPVSELATIQGAVIAWGDLAAALARTSVSGYQGEPVDFVDRSALSVTLASSSKATGAIELALSGSPTLVWKFDITAIQKALLGKPKAEFESIIKGFAPAVAKAQARIRPFWWSTFPTDPRKITVTEEKTQ